MPKFQGMALMGLMVCACSVLPQKEGRIFLDSSVHSDSPPHWVKELKTSWEDKGRIHYRSTHSIRGDERVNGCFELARLDVKENLLSEIANDVKGSIDNANQSLLEAAEVVLGKVRSGEFSGRITGLRFSEQYFERYLIGEVERIDCHVLGEISPADYQLVKRNVINRMVQADSRLKEAITRKHIDFFAPRESAEAPQKAEPARADN